MQSLSPQERFKAREVVQVLRKVLQDAEASGRLRRRSDEAVSGVVSELVSREWMDWDDDRLVLTDIGRQGLSVLKREAAAQQL